MASSGSAGLDKGNQVTLLSLGVCPGHLQGSEGGSVPVLGELLIQQEGSIAVYQPGLGPNHSRLRAVLVLSQLAA